MAIKSNVPLLTSVNLLSGFGDNQVSQVVEHASKMFSLASVYEYVDIWHANVAIEILYVLNLIFGDIDYNFEDEQLDDCSFPVPDFDLWCTDDNDIEYSDFFTAEDMHAFLEDQAEPSNF